MDLVMTGGFLGESHGGKTNPTSEAKVVNNCA